jgi:type VI secretion system secreted protein Hcp
MSIRVVRLALAITALSTLAVVVAPSSAWAWRGLATIQGTIQGPIQGDNTTKDGAGAVVVRAISLGLSRPLDSATGQVIGKLSLKPFRMVKEPDRATPKLLKAAVTNEGLTVEIKWFRSISTGAEQHYFTIKLDGARIVELESEGDVTVAGGVLEAVSLTYTKITMTDVINGTVAAADFLSP